MRQIKFRSKNGNTELYEYNLLPVTNRVAYCIESQKEVLGEYDEYEQFSGFKDKNGKEIYEGDILSEEVEVDSEMVVAKYPVFFHEKFNLWCIDTSFYKNRTHFDYMHELELEGLYINQEK